MPIYRYTVIFEPTGEGGYVASVPALNGLAMQGETLDEAREMARAVSETRWPMPHHFYSIPRRTPHRNLRHHLSCVWGINVCILGRNLTRLIKSDRVEQTTDGRYATTHAAVPSTYGATTGRTLPQSATPPPLGTFYFHWGDENRLWLIECDEGFSLDDLLREIAVLEHKALGRVMTPPQSGGVMTGLSQACVVLQRGV
jgi:hypothetical protein